MSKRLMGRSLTLAVAAAGLWIGFTTPATASSQILGIVASLEPTPLTCDDVSCRAEVTSFCLQQSRDGPKPGTAYSPMAGAAIALVGARADGSVVRLPATDLLRFEAPRGYMTIRVILPIERMQALGLASAAIEIGDKVSLLPIDPPGDTDKQSPEEIALAVGAYRAQAQQFFDAPGAEADALRVTNALVNALPERGRQKSDSSGAIWGNDQVATITSAVTPEGLAQATEIHATCQYKVDVTHHIETMRDCLEGSHDRLSVRTNIDLWESLGGS